MDVERLATSIFHNGLPHLAWAWRDRGLLRRSGQAGVRDTFNTKAYGLKALSMDTRPKMVATLGKVRLARIKMHAAANPSAPHGQVSSKGGPTLLRQRVLADLLLRRRTPKLELRPHASELLFRLLL